MTVPSPYWSCERGAACGACGGWRSLAVQGWAACVVEALALVDVLPPLSRAVVSLTVRFERLLPREGGLPAPPDGMGWRYLFDGGQPAACLGLHVRGTALVRHRQGLFWWLVQKRTSCPPRQMRPLMMQLLPNRTTKLHQPKLKPACCRLCSASSTCVRFLGRTRPRPFPLPPHFSSEDSDHCLRPPHRGPPQPRHIPWLLTNPSAMSLRP